MNLDQIAFESLRKPDTRIDVSHIDNGPLLAETGLRIVHVRKSRDGVRDVTVAYKQLHNSPLVEIATAITNPEDTFCKKLGTLRAVEHFQAGKTIMMAHDPKSGEALVSRFKYAFG